jgi:hypothetical protein
MIIVYWSEFKTEADKAIVLMIYGLNLVKWW